MFLPDLVVRGRRIVTRDGVTPAALHIRGGRIVGVLDYENVPESCPLDDAGDLVVMPGLVDTHVHVNASAPADGHVFDETTRGAAAGGVTTIVDTGPPGRPTASVAAVEQKRRAAEGHCFVDVAFSGGIAPGNSHELGSLAQSGVFGFACTFGIPAIDGADAVSERDLRDAMPALARVGATLMVHGEVARPIEPVVDGRSAKPFALRCQAFALRRQAFALRGQIDRLTSSLRRDRGYARFLEQHPKEAETEAVVRLLELCREYRTATHIVNLSSSDALTPIFRARAARLPVTVATCPHYVFFAAEEVPDGATAFKCVPPVRDRVNRELLLGALSGGLIQSIASDYSPAGVTSLELSLPVVWTVASARDHSVNHLAAWMCRAPARIAGIRRKGDIDVGYDADLVIWDPDAEFTVDTAPVAYWRRGRSNPYAGRSLRGVVARVYLRGKPIYRQGRPIGDPTGHLLVNGNS